MAITETKHAQITKELRELIATLDPGDRVPTEPELMREYRVSRDTARRGILPLIHEGLVTPGRPRMVARHEPRTIHLQRDPGLEWGKEGAVRGADAWTGDTHRAGYEPAQDIEVVAALASAEAARRLGIAEGDVVTARRLVRYADGQPDNLITFWFPYKVAHRTPLAGPASITEGSITWLERAHGPLIHEREPTEARMPSPAETTALRIPPGVPVMVVWRTSQSQDGPVVTSMAVYPADRARLL